MLIAQTRTGLLESVPYWARAVLEWPETGPPRLA
jgi:hypothetical protein